MAAETHEVAASGEALELRGSAPPSSHVLWLVLAVALCYANSLRVPFLFDDPQPERFLDYSTRPLVWGSFALNRWISGGATWSYHVFNALVHLACGLLLLGVLRQVLARALPGVAAGTRARLALATTLLWLCHPLQTEAVTYLSQRAETMSACFYLAVVYAFLRAAARARPRAWQLVTLAALALGMATKELVATAPVFLFLCDACCLSPGPRAALRARPRFYAILALATLGLAAAFVLPPLLKDQSMGLSFHEFSALDYARTQPGVLLHYLRLVVWPQPLCFDPAWPIARVPADYVWQALVLVALLATTGVLLARRSWIGLAGALFFLVLAPTSSIVPIRDPAFEHRMYLPLAAVLVLVVCGVWRLLADRPRALALLAGAATLVLGALTVRRNRDYRSAESLWRATIACAPHNARAYGQLGAELIELERVDEAIQQLKTALELQPLDGYTYLNLGKAFLRLGQPEPALAALAHANELVVDARFLDLYGGALFLAGEPRAAVVPLEKSIALEPRDPTPHYKLGRALGALGETKRGLEELAEALRLDPGLEDAHLESADVLLAEGRSEEALAHFRQALALPPDGADEHFRLGQALQGLGRLAEAVGAYGEAIRIDPELPEARIAAAECLCSMPDAAPEQRREALALAQQANELVHGERFEFLAVLAMTQASLGSFAEAARTVEKALALPGPRQDPTLAGRLRAMRDEYAAKARR